MSTDHILQRILDKSRDARDHGYGVLSTGEALAAALVLDRHDWLAEMGYTMAEAIERLGPQWLARIPAAARQLLDEAEVQRGEA